jgi:hypothetical protein
LLSMSRAGHGMIPTTTPVGSVNCVVRTVCVFAAGGRPVLESAVPPSSGL